MEEQQGPRACACVRVMKGFAYSSSDPPRICRLAPGSRCFPATRCKRVVSASATTATCRTIFSRERCKRAFQLFSPPQTATSPPRAFRTTTTAVILNKRGASIKRYSLFQRTYLVEKNFFIIFIALEFLPLSRY